MRKPFQFSKYCIFVLLVFSLISLIVIFQVVSNKFHISSPSSNKVCAFNNFHPIDEQVRPFFFKMNPRNCSNPLLTYVQQNSNSATLFLKQELIDKNIQCYREKIIRGTPIDIRLIDRQVFSKSIEIDSTPVLVTCMEGNNAIYMNTHQAILKTKEVQNRIENSNLKNAFSVLIIGIDSVSRLNFIRSLPLTYKFLLANDWLEFEKYNKIALNTLPNLMALLTGSTQVRNPFCIPGKYQGLENCSFIWNDFQEAGFVTATAEDAFWLSTFNYRHNFGFYKTPTDYYFRPYFVATETLLPIEHMDYLPYCSGPENHGQRMLDLISNFSTTFRHHPTFSLFWMNSFSHCNLNDVGIMDSKLLEFFEKLQNNKILENTVVIFLSDHGIQDTNFRKTLMGWFEERLPFFFIKVPKKFQMTFNTKYKRLVENTKKIASPYDVYMTLQHILKLSRVHSKTQQSTDCPTCKSLFTRIKSERSCDDAGIGLEWCTCLKLEAFNTNSSIVEQASTFMINKLNNIITENKIDKICSKFQLKDVEAVETNKLRNILRLVITTYPKAVFEGTLLSKKYGFLNYRFSGIISRIERYAPTSYCIQNKTLEPYCYCI